METGQEQCERSVCGGASIKQEPVETGPFMFPKQEIEDVFVKEESPFLHEWEVLGDLNSAQDPLSIEKEECSPSKDYFGPSTSNIGKTEDVEDNEETVSNIDVEEFKCEVESTSSGSEPESTFPIGIDDSNGADCSGVLDTKVDLTAGRGNRIQFSTKQEASYENESVSSHLVHWSGMGKKTSQMLQDKRVHTVSCSVCHKTFTNSRSLKRHFHLHSVEGPYSCGICNKTLKHSSTLKKHSLLHTGERPYSCGVCKKTFTQRGILKKHSMLHTGERPFSCGVCKKTFTQSCILKKHSLLHTGERPYSCSVCYKTFTESGNLKMHSLVHTGERPYSCGVCNKTFRQSSNLKRHSLLHTGERPYSCAVCDKTFTYSSTLKKHSLLHTGERRYRCGVCNKTFTYCTSLKRHSFLHTG